MGPVQRDDESLADYRFRYVAYCGKWLLASALGTAVFVLCAQVLPMPKGFAVVAGIFAVFAIGMPAVAMFGFFIGGMYVRAHGTVVERGWRSIVAVVAIALAFIAFVFCCVQVVLVLQGNEIWSFQRRGGRWLTWAHDPLLYSVSAFSYAACVIGLLTWFGRKLRRRLATSCEDDHTKLRS